MTFSLDDERTAKPAPVVPVVRWAVKATHLPDGYGIMWRTAGAEHDWGAERVKFACLPVADFDALTARVAALERERDEAIKVADLATDAAAKAVLDAKEVYEVRHLTRIKALEAERDTALARIKAMEERVAAMREALAECLSWMRCDCGHPACKRCPATKDGDAALAEREG